MAPQAKKPRKRKSYLRQRKRKRQADRRLSAPRLVTISERDPHTLAVEPACEELLSKVLSYPKRSWNASSNSSQISREPFYRIEEDKLLVPMGLYAVVAGALRLNEVQVDRQYQLRYRDLGSIPADLQLPDRFQALRSLAPLPRGTIVVPQTADAAQVIAAIGDTFPTAQIAVCTHSWNAAQKLCSRIATHTNREVVIDRKNYVNRHFSEPERHVIQVMSGEANEGASMRDFFDIRIDVGESVAFPRGKSPTPWLLDSMRVFSILEKREFSRHETLMLFAEYSDHTLEIPAENVPPTVRFLRVPGGELKFPKGGSAFEFARDQIWPNEARNQRIARLAEALRTGNAAALDELGVALPEGLQEVLFSNPAPGISILVANPTHGRQLQAQLPEFEFVHSTTSQSEYPSFDPAAPVITTHASADTFGIASRVVIRADGGSGWPLQARAFPLQQPDNGPAILIDIEDQGDAAVGNFWNSRLKTYNELGWNNPLQDSEKNQ